jgi:thioredoxin 1
MIEIINESNFDQKVLEAPGKVLVELFAAWCPHCQRMMPVVNEVANRLEGSVVVYQVDVDKSPNLAAKYAPDGFPCFVLFENGEVVDSLIGEQPESALLQLAK